jgi:hypothetical protein
MVSSRSLIRRSFMKKIIALTVALALFASTAFAAPISVAASLVEPVTAQTVSPSASADLDALFSDVTAVPLTDSEAQAVEGEGFFGALIGAVIGVVIGLGCGLVVGVITGDVSAGVIGGVTGGATVGAIGGAFGTAF